MEETLSLNRIVRMTFHPDKLASFLALFDTVSPRIRSFPGCLHLEVWQDVRFPNRITTFSRWTNAVALEAYRTSPVFREAWEPTKALFAAPPEATSYTTLRAG